MLTHIHVPGIQYEGETVEQMQRRERRTAQWNAYIARVMEFWKAERQRPWWQPRQHHPPLPPVWLD